MKIKQILILLFFVLLYQLNANDYSSFQKGDTVQVLNIKKHYTLRIFIFTDESMCSVCNSNIIILQELLKYLNIEFNIIINNADNDDVSAIKKETKWSGNIISDEFGIYKEKYKIIKLPVIIITDNNGMIIDLGKLGGNSIDVNLIKGYYSKFSKDSIEQNNSSLTLINRIELVENGEKVRCGKFFDAIYSPKYKKYIFRTNRTCPIFIADSNGIVVNKIDSYKYKTLGCSFIVYNMSWAFSDSLVGLYFASERNTPQFQLYNIVTDSLYPPIDFIIDNIGLRDRNSYYGYFLTNTDKFLMSFNINKYKNISLTDNEKMIYLYGYDGRLAKCFGCTDSLFIRNKRSWNQFSYSIIDTNSFYSYQWGTKRIHTYSVYGELINTFNIELSSNCRTHDKDMDSNITQETQMKLYNEISNFYLFQHDSKKDLFLIKYQNTDVPDGILDIFDPKVKLTDCIEIFDKDGRAIFNSPIEMNNLCNPIYFENGFIYAAEVIDKKLTIAIYKLNN